jgi:hypothetical protein
MVDQKLPDRLCGIVETKHCGSIAMTKTRTTGLLAATGLFLAILPASLHAEEVLPWEKPAYGREAPPTSGKPYAYSAPRATDDPYNPNVRSTPAPTNRPRTGYVAPPPTQPTYRPTQQPDAYNPPQSDGRRPYAAYRQPPPDEPQSYHRPPPSDPRDGGTYSHNEILDAGHRFFGSVSSGLARAVARLFKSAGAPNGYILGEEASGAFVAGLRYGEGVLYTKSFGRRRVYWQGPTVGYDFGGEGSRTMVLVYNLPHTSAIFKRYAGVQGSAYVIGGVGVQLLKHGGVTLAPIRSGVGLRLGASVGYLKYTPRPTWNPF